MANFCPFTPFVMTPSVSWRETFSLMSFDADLTYIAQLWEQARNREEDCSEVRGQSLDEPKETTRKSTTQEIRKLLRHATAKTLRYAQRDSYRRHKDSTYIVLNNLADDGYSDDDCCPTGSNPDFVRSASFRSSLSTKAERIIRRKRR